MKEKTNDVFKNGFSHNFQENEMEIDDTDKQIINIEIRSEKFSLISNTDQTHILQKSF